MHVLEASVESSTCNVVPRCLACAWKLGMCIYVLDNRKLKSLLYFYRIKLSGISPSSELICLYIMRQMFSLKNTKFCHRSANSILRKRKYNLSTRMCVCISVYCHILPSYYMMIHKLFLEIISLYIDELLNTM